MRGNQRSQRESQVGPAEPSQPAGEVTMPAPTTQSAAARVIYTEPPVLLGQVLSIVGDGLAQVRVGASERHAVIDPSVDPALVLEAIATGARVVLEAGHPPVIVGLLSTHRTLAVDRHGDLKGRLRNLALEMDGSLLLKTPLAFLQMDKEGAVEMFGQRLLSRARKVAKILAAHISLN